MHMTVCGGYCRDCTENTSLPSGENRTASQLSIASGRVDSRQSGSLVSKFVLTETNSWPVIYDVPSVPEPQQGT